jgi:thioredoxin 1
MSKSIEITNDNFKEVLETEKIVVLDFWAEWCGPCRMVGPIIDELAADYEEKVVVSKINVDDNPEISANYGIRNIPTILFLKNGEVYDKQLGAVAKATLAAKIDSNL